MYWYRHFTLYLVPCLFCNVCQSRYMSIFFTVCLPIAIMERNDFLLITFVVNNLLFTFMLQWSFMLNRWLLSKIQKLSYYFSKYLILIIFQNYHIFFNINNLNILINLIRTCLTRYLQLYTVTICFLIAHNKT